MRLFYGIALFFSLYFNAQDYTSKWYKVDDGLSQNTIKDIIKDKYGFIWFTTESGLVRYDGKNFLLHDQFKSSNLFLSNFFGNVKKDSLLVFNESYDDAFLISKREPKEIKYKNLGRNSLPQDHKIYRRYYKNSLVQSFYRDVDYYYIKTNSGTYYFNNELIEFTKNNQSKKDLIKKNFRHKDLKSVFVHGDTVFITDPVHRRLVRLRNGVVSYDTMPSLYNDPKSKIYWHQTTGQIFIINNENIYKSEIVNGKLKLHFLMRYHNVEKHFFTAIFFDDTFNKLYFGNLTEGLNIVNLSRFYTSQKNIPFSNEVAYAALPFSKNSIITEEGIEYFKDKTKVVFPISTVEDNRSLLRDGEKNLVYRSYNSILKRQSKFNFAKKDSVVFPKMRIKALFENGGQVMATVADENLHCYVYTFTDRSFKQVKSRLLFPDYVNHVLVYHKDFMYVGCDNGLYIVSLSKNKIVKHLAKNIPVKQIIRTRDGNFWLTTYNKGFYLIKGDHIIKLPDDKNNYISTAHTLLEDHYSNLWISSNNGLFRVSKKKLLDYAENRNSKVTYYRYTKEFGLLNNEFNGSSNPSANVLENGELVFPSMEGFVFFKPDEIKNYYPEKDQLFINKALVDHKNVVFDHKLILKSDYEKTEIMVDIPYYYSLENIDLEAKIDGKDSKWQYVGDDRKFSLSKLEPGNYNLIVRYLVNDKGEYNYKKIEIEIQPYFYETVLFKILVIFIGIAIIIFIIRQRTKSLNKELKETNTSLIVTRNKLENESEYQKKIVESISHDITTPVKFITLLSQKILETEDRGIQKEYFESIYHSSEQLYKFTLGLKNYTELYKEENETQTEEYMLYDLLDAKKMLFQEIALQNDTLIHVFCDQNVVTTINEKLLSVIIHNIIDNAVKNTGNGEIIISVKRVGSKIEIHLSDTGRGMSKEQLHYYSQIIKSIDDKQFIFKNYGLGLQMVVQLVKKINADISFNENNPQGTVVVISLNN